MLPDVSHHAGKPDKLDMRAFLGRQGQERYRAFVLHSPPREGKTTFARRLAQETGGVYLDMLQIVASDAALSAQVDVLDAAFLKTKALEAAQSGANLVLIDEFDFLLPIWGRHLAQLFEIVRKLSSSDTSATIGFVMQTVPMLETLSYPTTFGQNRILRLDAIQSL